MYEFKAAFLCFETKLLKLSHLDEVLRDRLVNFCTTSITPPPSELSELIDGGVSSSSASVVDILRWMCAFPDYKD